MHGETGGGGKGGGGCKEEEEKKKIKEGREWMTPNEFPRSK